MKKAVVGFGRMNPSTTGHEVVASKIATEARKRNAEARLYLSHTTNPKKDPLPYDDKVKFATAAFKHLVKVINSPARTIIEVAVELEKEGFTEMTVVVGEDRVREFNTLLQKYNGKDFTFDKIEVIKAGDRDPDADDVTGMSASKMRKLASEGDFEAFSKGAPSKLSKAMVKQMYDKVRKNMRIAEQFELDSDEDSLDEFTTISSYSKSDVDKPLIKFKKIKDRYRKLINTPLSNEFDVYYLGDTRGGFHEYVFTEKDTGEPIGSFEIEMPWGNTRRPKVVKPGVRIVTPHLSFIPKYQGKGLAKKTYLAFLRMKNYVFETDRHTKEAAILWNSLAKERDIVTFYYDKDTGKISKTEMNTNDEVKYLGLKSDFNLPKGIKEDIDVEFEELFSEDLRNWFSKSHPQGDWVRMNSKGNIIGPCAREPGEPKPKCLPRQRAQSLSKQERASAVSAKRRADPDAERTGKPINVRVPADKKKLSESYDLSDSSALNLLLLGSSVDEHDLPIGEQKDMKLLKDRTGRVRVFMLRAAAAREAHTHNGTVQKYKNGYVIQLKENEDVEISKRTVRDWLGENRERTPVGCDSETLREESGRTTTSGFLTEATCEESTTEAIARLARPKITLAKIRQRKTQTEANGTGSTSSDESTQINEIDKGIEPGLSMAGAGESIGRDMGEKIKKKSHKVTTVEAIGAGGEMATSMSDYNENDLKRKGIDLKSFKAKRPIG